MDKAGGETAADMNIASCADVRRSTCGNGAGRGRSVRQGKSFQTVIDRRKRIIPDFNPRNAAVYLLLQLSRNKMTFW